jgi:hypothetical protein
MDTATFLACVVAPGNYFAVCYKGPGKPMGQRFFPRANTQEAAGFIRWADGKGMDVWFSPASFKLAEAKGHDPMGNPTYKGERTHPNVDKLQCFWYDADIKRDGDGKDPSRCFISLNDVKNWLIDLTIPQPNLAVRSGYGVHLYWVIDHAYTRVEWQTRADWVKAMLIAHKAPGDVQITGDASRILRPPNTRNHKVVDQPAPVTVLWDTLNPAANYGTD